MHCGRGLLQAAGKGPGLFRAQACRRRQAWGAWEGHVRLNPGRPQAKRPAPLAATLGLACAGLIGGWGCSEAPLVVARGPELCGRLPVAQRDMDASTPVWLRCGKWDRNAGGQDHPPRLICDDPKAAMQRGTRHIAIASCAAGAGRCRALVAPCRFGAPRSTLLRYARPWWRFPPSAALHKGDTQSGDG